MVDQYSAADLRERVRAHYAAAATTAGARVRAEIGDDRSRFADPRRDQRSPGPEEGGRPGKHLAADRVEYQVDLAGRVLDAIGVQLDEAVGGDRRTWVAT